MKISLFIGVLALAAVVSGFGRSERYGYNDGYDHGYGGSKKYDDYDDDYYKGGLGYRKRGGIGYGKRGKHGFGRDLFGSFFGGKLFRKHHGYGGHGNGFGTYGFDDKRGHGRHSYGKGHGDLFGFGRSYDGLYDGSYDGSYGGERYGEKGDKLYGRSHVKDADRAQDYYGKSLRYGDQEKYIKDSDEALKHAEKGYHGVAKKSHDADYADFDHADYDKKKSSVHLSYAENKDKDSGSKTSYSSGSKNGSAFKAEKDGDLHHEEYDKHQAAAESETVKDAEHKHKNAHERVYDADIEEHDKSYHKDHDYHH